MARPIRNGHGVVSAVKALCYSGLDTAALCERVNARLCDALESDGAVFLALDPASALPLGAVSRGWTPESCDDFRENAYLAGPISDFGRRARQAPVSRLRDLLHGDAKNDPYVDVLTSHGFAHDLQTMLVFGQRPIAWLSLARCTSSQYSDDEVKLMHVLAPHLAAGMRAAAMRSSLGAAPGREIGMVLLNRGGGIEVVNGVAERLLANAGKTANPGVWYTVQTVASLLNRALEQQRDVACVPSATIISDGQRYTVRAERGRGADGYERGIVFIEPSRTDDYADVFDSFGLSPREIEIALALVRGATNVEIAAELGVSPHTVKTHVGAIFTKTGVGSRRELGAHMAGAALATA